VQLPAEFDLETIDATTAVYITVGNDYTFTAVLSEAVKSKIDTPLKGGNATFQVWETDETKDKEVVTETITLRWDKKKVMLVKVVGKPLAGSDKNIVDLSSEDDGPVTGTIDGNVSFGDVSTDFSIDYAGKKKSKLAKDKTTELIGWNVSGKQ